MRILIAGGSRDFGTAFNDGFVTRHRRLARHLAARHEVGLLALREHGDGSAPSPDLEPLVLADIAVPVVQSRRQRAGVMSRRFRPVQPTGWAHDIAREADTFSPDVVVTFGPWLDHQYEYLRRRYPTVHFFEEDTSPLFPIGPMRLTGRAFAAAERAAHYWARGRVPAVVTISAREEAAARRRYRGARVETLPFTLPDDDWPLAPDRSQGCDLLVVAALDQERNAAGLVDILGELARRQVSHIPVVLVSAGGLHPTLSPFRDLDWVRQETCGEQLWPRYRTSRMSLVPARRVTGIKTTILQSWSQGTPVLAFHASADTLPTVTHHGLLAAADAGNAVDLLLQAWDDEDLLTRLSNEGRRAYTTHFDETATLERAERLVTEVRGGRFSS
ncbi:MAG: glycosyltransferase [Actinomycetota bacterium]|nr:glycosyltransferase [Actinomycetota bacterium]